jgi:hypothetical protein
VARIVVRAEETTPDYPDAAKIVLRIEICDRKAQMNPAVVHRMRYRHCSHANLAAILISVIDAG